MRVRHGDDCRPSHRLALILSGTTVPVTLFLGPMTTAYCTYQPGLEERVLGMA